MSDVSITYAGIFHVKDDLWRFINTMEDHQKVLVFTINGENNIKSIFRIETSGIQKLLMQIGIPANADWNSCQPARFFLHSDRIRIDCS